MTRALILLLIAQFLTAFADNAVMFTVFAMVLHAEHFPGWYTPALQASFLLAFVLLAPWVGALADAQPKPRILVAGNLVKLIGAGLLMLGVEPLLAYGLVGAGAALYSPAKYGILPELTSAEWLVKANSWVEATTIAAIVLGAVAGGRLGDASIALALLMVVLLYALSGVVSLFIRSPRETRPQRRALRQFVGHGRTFLAASQARFALLGSSLFWATAAVLRVMIIAWAPLVLGTRSSGDIAELTVFLALGVITGSALVPTMIPLHALFRARWAGYAMGGQVLLFALVGGLWPARLMLLGIGIAGGIFIVPLNAALQDVGHRTIGSGHAVAIQNFAENLAMLFAVGIYTAAAGAGTGPIPAIAALGLGVILLNLALARKAPR